MSHKAKCYWREITNHFNEESYFVELKWSWKRDKPHPQDHNIALNMDVPMPVQLWFFGMDWSKAIYWGDPTLEGKLKIFEKKSDTQ